MNDGYFASLVVLPIWRGASVDYVCLMFVIYRKFTRLPHLAGTQQNLDLAEQIGAEWMEFGLDSVELVPYDVLLSYPNKTRPNYISIVDHLGNEVLTDNQNPNTHKQGFF